MTARYSVMIALFPYGHVIDDRLMTYVVKLTGEMARDKRIEKHCLWQESDTPITMLRNKCLVEAEQLGYDFVLMLDSDNLPDYEQNGKPFFWSSFDFATDTIARKGLPTIIAAPYCGPGPSQCVYVFDWTNHKNTAVLPDIKDILPDFSIEMVSRHEAAERKGILPAAALPTGVCLIDMRIVKKMPHPRFDYEWKDERQIQKASTEDVMFTRNASYIWQDHGPVIFCNWDAWALHVKQQLIGKPQNFPTTWVPSYIVQQCREALKLGIEPERPAMQAQSVIRPHNSWPAPPKGFPVELIRTRDVVVAEPEPQDEEPPAELVAAMNGDGIG